MCRSVAQLGLFTCLLLSLTGCGTVVPDPARGPKKDGPRAGALPPALSSEPNDDGLVTQIRPMVSKLGKDDAIRYALHWETKVGPIQWRFEDKELVDWRHSLDTMKFHVTTPDGGEHVLTAKFQAKQGSNATSLSQSPSLFLVIDEDGAKETARQMEGKWNEKVPSLSKPGSYKVRVEGSLVDAEPAQTTFIPFQSKPVTVELGVDGYVSIAKTEEIAKKALEAKFSEKIKAEASVIEDVNGNRIVKLTGPSKKLWHFRDYLVAVSPQGTVGEITFKEVGNCVAEGTMLEGEKGPIAIDEVRAGRRVWGYDLAKKQRVLTTVEQVRSARVNGVLVLAGRLRVTDHHPVYVNGRWTAARNVVESDHLLSSAGARLRVSTIRRELEPLTVFDLTVSEPHNFFANGILVHNKSRAYDPKLDDWWYRLWPAPAKKE